MLGIIINPKSGGRAYKRQRLYLFKLLKEHNIPFEYKTTQYASHASELARSFVEDGFKDLLVLGGDGTLSEVVNGVMSANKNINKQDITLGLMPRGTGNDWARWCGLDKNYKKSLDIYFRTGKRQPIDIGCITLWRGNREEKHYFINSVGFGIDAKTCKKANQLKPYIGSHSYNYFFGLISALFTHKSVPVNLTTDSNYHTEKPLFTMNIGNGPYSGGGIKQNPDANPTDGYFNSMFVSKPSIKLIISALPKLFNGKLKSIPFIDYFTAREINLYTSKYTMFEKDGILVDACGPYKISIIHNALNMIIANNTNT